MENNSEEKKEAKESELIFQGLKDWLLESIVRTTNTAEGMGLQLTLISSGTVISGTLIGVREYFDEVIKLSPNSKFFQSLYEIKDRMYPMEQIKRDDENGVLANYIHMKGAKFYVASGAGMPGEGILWRGKISEINGFSFGELTVK